MSAPQPRGAASVPAAKPRKERQTRLQEHLRTVKSTRGISPASSAAKAKAATAPVDVSATGRPKRKAAARVVMQEVGSESEEDDESDGGSEAEDVFEEEEEEAKPTPRRGRRAPAPKRSASVESFSPSPSRTTRKSPVKQNLTPAKNPRQREISNLSIDVDTMNDHEVQQRLQQEKLELMARLAQHGINPQADVLDSALRSMHDSNEKLTVDSFLRALSSLNADPSPAGHSRRPLPPAPLALHRSPPAATPKKGSFSMLESPSTPSAADRPAFTFPSPPQASSHAGAPVALLPVPPAQPSLLPSPPGFGQVEQAAQQPQQQQQKRVLNPAAFRANRLAAFANRSHSAPVVPTLNLALPTPAPVASVSSPAQPGLVPTAIQGMGRVALSRRSLFGQPTPVQQQQQQPDPAALLPAFACSGPVVGTDAAPAERNVPSATDDRLRKLRSWLDDDDEDESPTASNKPDVDAAAEATLKAAAAGKVDLAKRRDSEMKMVDVPASDDEEAPGAAARARVGGKSVQTLRQSHKRHLDEDNAAPQLPSPQKPTTRSTAAKGKQKAVTDCLCGKPADEEDAVARCGECDATFHLGCLGVSSERQLPPSWACERCAPDAHDARRIPQQQQTPPLSAKRIRIGTNSTPVLEQLPMLVASTFSPAPRRNNDFSDCADIALAPSPQQSPIRSFAPVPAAAPVSPTPSSAKLAIPTTPQFGSAALRNPSDYSPHSPQRYRQRRARIASNGGAFSALLSGSSGWDEPSAFDSALGDDFLSLGGSAAHHLSGWSDVTMTPSRALSSAQPTPGTAGGSASATSALLDTPYMTHARGPSFGISGGHLRTPSAAHGGAGGDFLSSLDAPAHHLAHSAPAFSNRLFAHADDAPYSFGGAGVTSSPSFRPVSPLNPRRVPPGTAPQLNHHRRTSSSFGGSAGLNARLGLGGPWSPTPAHAMSPPSLQGSWSPHERRMSSTGMKVSQSMPGLRGFDGQELDELAF